MAEGNFEQPDQTPKSERMSRRNFIKFVGRAVAGLAIVEPIERLNSSVNSHESADLKEKFPVLSGSVEEGDTLTSVAERIIGKDNIATQIDSFKLIWKNDGVDYLFTSKEAFLWQDLAPLPFAQPGDEIFMGVGERSEEELLKDKKYLNSDKRVVMYSGFDKDVNKKIFTINGDRYDVSVRMELKEDGSIWEVALDDKRMGNAQKFKDLMISNPSMNSSEALSQL